jgi:hypothetical protein
MRKLVSAAITAGTASALAAGLTFEGVVGWQVGRARTLPPRPARSHAAVAAAPVSSVVCWVADRAPEVQGAGGT